MSGNIFHWAVCPAMRMVTWFSSCPPGSLVSGPKCGGKDWEKGQSGAKIQLTLLLKKDKWKTKMIGSGLLFRGHRSAFSQREWQKLFLCLVALLVCYAEPEDCLEQTFCHFLQEICPHLIVEWHAMQRGFDVGYWADQNIHFSEFKLYIYRMAFDMNKRLE